MTGKVTQSCPTLCKPMDCTVHGILQAGLEWVAFPFSRGPSQSRDQTRYPALQVDSLPAKPQGKPKSTGVDSLSLLQWIFPTQESSPALQADSLPTELSGKHKLYHMVQQSHLWYLSKGPENFCLH